MATATARLEARVPPHIHQAIKQAAALEGRSMSDFVVQVAFAQAKKTIQEHHQLGFVLELSPEDQAQLLEHILNPPPMNDAMKRALAIHEQHFKDSL